MHTIRYTYKEFKDCKEATELSRKWESFRAIAWVIWMFVASGGILGAWVISRFIKNEYDVSLIPLLLIFILTFIAGYKYVYNSKYVYPTCEELFLLSQRSPGNFTAIEQAVSVIRQQKKKEIKKAIVKYFIIYFLILIFYILFCLEA